MYYYIRRTNVRFILTELLPFDTRSSPDPDQIDTRISSIYEATFRTHG